MDGISYTTYLKLCLMSSTQAKTGALQRMHGSSSGYDFYKRMKLAAQDVASGTTDPSDILEQLSTIKRTSEREHNLFVATRFRDWWLARAADGCVPHAERPRGEFQRASMPFKVRLNPELRYMDNGVDKVIYLWATAKPQLTKQVAATGISILTETFANTQFSKCEFEIFDLRKNRMLGSDTITNTTATNLAGDLAQISAIWSEVS